MRSVMRLSNLVSGAADLRTNLRLCFCFCFFLISAQKDTAQNVQALMPLIEEMSWKEEM